MPDITTSVRYLAKLPLYEKEKPFSLLPSANLHSEENFVATNLEFEVHDGILVRDLREHLDQFTLEKSGFEIKHHVPNITVLDTAEQMNDYQEEIKAWLKFLFKAEHVTCYEIRRRKNIPFHQTILDLRDPLLLEGASTAAHVDATMDSGPKILDFRLTEEEKKRYLKPGYRFRVINTWRSLLPVCEDRPLAFLDYRSVDKEDLVPCDRVIPTRAGEVYYLYHNPEHQWYWLDKMSRDELALMVMYDTAPGDHARYCPHVAVNNPSASADAPPRYSVETRSIVITKY